MSAPLNPVAVMSDCIWAGIEETCTGYVNRKDEVIDSDLEMDLVAETVLNLLADAATVTTVEQLDALPTGCVVQDVDKAWTRRPRSWWSLPFPHTTHDTPRLPAILLYHPDARHR